MTEKVVEIISGILNTAADSDSSQETCESWDSLHHINIIVALEEAFDVEFEPEEIAEMTSVVAIEQMINQKLS